MSERIDAEIKKAVCEAAGEPRSEVRARALAGMSRVRRPRSRALSACLICGGVVLLAAVAALACTIAFPVDGTLYFREADGVQETGILGIFSRAVRGYEISCEGLPSFDADPSPDGEKVACSFMASDTGWPPVESEIFLADMRGATETSLTGRAGITGINCCPRWSPDGSLIAFRHCDPEPERERYPCRIGFELWVMNSDGSGAHRVTPQEFPDVSPARWSPDGSWLIAYVGSILRGGHAITTDIQGANIRVLPNVGTDPAYSPDGSMIASSDAVRDVLDGQPGVWRRLILTKADGGDPEVLVEQFLVEAEIEAHYPTPEQAARYPDRDWTAEVQGTVGPRVPQWSPSGDKIAFQAAMPLDPAGPNYRLQVDVWIYDLTSDTMSNITNDDLEQYGLVWKE
jgi:Tol biopolymer transport system component